MTLGRRRPGRQQEHADAFVEQAAEEETAQLHCETLAASTAGSVSSPWSRTPP